jgi:hypothetical protein
MVAIDISDDDFVYEEECLRNPHSVQTWLRYIEHKQDGSFEGLNMIYEVKISQFSKFLKHFLAGAETASWILQALVQVSS